MQVSGPLNSDLEQQQVKTAPYTSLVESHPTRLAFHSGRNYVYFYSVAQW